MEVVNEIEKASEAGSTTIGDQKPAPQQLASMQETVLGRTSQTDANMGPSKQAAADTSQVFSRNTPVYLAIQQCRNLLDFYYNFKFYKIQNGNITCEISIRICLYLFMNINYPE